MPRHCPWHLGMMSFSNYVDFRFQIFLHLMILQSGDEMLRCRYCIRNLLEAVIVDLPTFRPVASPRSFSTGTRLKSYTPLSTVNRLQAIQPTSIENASQDQDNDLENRDERRELETELKYLQDPVKLAERVHGLLAQGKVQRALQLLKLASRDRSCTVSWNHVINHEMKQGRTASALKIYNDVRLSFKL